MVGEELEMLSRRKSFAIALSRDMVPTARVVVYYLSGQPEEIVVDSLTFFVDGTANNKVGHYFLAEIQFMHWTSSCYKRGWGGIDIYMYNPENTSIQTDV